MWALRAQWVLGGHEEVRIKLGVWVQPGLPSPAFWASRNSPLGLGGSTGAGGYAWPVPAEESKPASWIRYTPSPRSRMALCPSFCR